MRLDGVPLLDTRRCQPASTVGVAIVVVVAEGCAKVTGHGVGTMC